MSSPLPPTRPRGEALPIVGGLFATGALHVVASILVVVIGSAATQRGDGAYLIFFFWAGIGLAQWVYLLPAWLLARALGWRAFGKGLLIAGAVGTLLNAMCWGTIGLGSVFR
jgi:hypothetical protein